MKKSYVNFTINQILNHYTKGTLLFNHPIQRKGGQWDLLSKSLLIHSILADYPVPPIYCIVDKVESENNKPVSVYQIIDGKQRLLNIFGFINGEYELHMETPDVECDEETYMLGGIAFNDLAKELQEKIKGFSLTTYKFDEYIDDEIEEMFFRLNNGVVLSKDQKTKAKLGTELAKKIDVYLESEFIKYCTFTASQLRKADDMAALLQGIMLIDNYNYNSFSSDEIMKFAIEKKNNFSDELSDKTTNILEYLSKFVTEIAPLEEDVKRIKSIKKYLKKINIPMLMKVAESALEKNIPTSDFLKWYENFFKQYQTGGFYGKYCAAGSVKKENVSGRVRTMANDFDEYFKQTNSEQPITEQANNGQAENPENTESVEALQEKIESVF